MRSTSSANSFRYSENGNRLRSQAQFTLETSAKASRWRGNTQDCCTRARFLTSSEKKNDSNPLKDEALVSNHHRKRIVQKDTEGRLLSIYIMRCPQQKLVSVPKNRNDLRALSTLENINEKRSSRWSSVQYCFMMAILVTEAGGQPRPCRNENSKTIHAQYAKH